MRGGMIGVALAGGLCLGAAACAGSTAPSGGSSPSATAPGTVSASPSSAPASPTSPAAPSPGSSRESIAGLPLYQPSRTVSRALGSVVLSTPDPVSKVAAYYLAEVRTGGWAVVSQSLTQYSASLVLKKSGQGASISVSPAPGSGTIISISTYPSP